MVATTDFSALQASKRPPSLPKVTLAEALLCARDALLQLEEAYRQLDDAARSVGCAPRLVLRNPVTGHTLQVLPDKLLIEAGLAPIIIGRTA